MPRQSAGILLYRNINQTTEFFLVHPGGPYFAGKNAGTWMIPKGEFMEEEDALSAARREFEEETGQPIDGNFMPLGSVKQKGGKIVHAWALEGDINSTIIASNTFDMEYPYKSGKWITVPEIDKAGWFTLDEAREKINPAQVMFLDKVSEIVAGSK
jgi:predicted NUDIX family NTP pyrophosphohydrolase